MSEEDRATTTRSGEYGESVASEGWGNFGRVMRAPISPAGRWPTNVLLDDSQAAELDRQSGERPGASDQQHNTKSGSMFTGCEVGQYAGYNDSGGASRFFPTFRYEAKAPSSERPRIPRNVLRLRADLTPEQVDHVRARLTEAGVQVD